MDEMSILRFYFEESVQWTLENDWAVAEEETNEEKDSQTLYFGVLAQRSLWMRRPGQKWWDSDVNSKTVTNVDR